MMMRRRDVLQSLCLAAALPALTIGGIRPARAATRIQRVVSPGGIEAWFVQDSTVPLVAMDYAFTGGATQDPVDKPGVSNMVADLLDEGAGDLDSNTFHDRLERRAIQMSFGTARDYFRGSLRMLKEDRDEAFDLLRLALTQPRFETDAVERIRSQIMSGLRRESTTPSALAALAFWKLAYPDHPYGRPSGGTLESVPTIQVTDLRDYQRRNFGRDQLKVAVVGDIDAATLGKLLDKAFAALPAKADLVAVPEIAPTAPPKREQVALDVPQTVVMFGAAALKRNDPEFMTAYVVNHILGGGTFSSRLHREVREKRGLVYSISEAMIWMSHSAMFVGSTATRADRTSDTVDTLTGEVRRLAESGPTQAELDEAKSYLKGSLALSLDTSAKIAAVLVQYQLDNVGIDYLERRAALIDAVTLDDAKRVARKLWGPGLLTVVVGRTAEATAQTTTAPPSPPATIKN
jgi:zinc protease